MVLGKEKHEALRKMTSVWGDSYIAREGEGGYPSNWLFGGYFPGFRTLEIGDSERKTGRG